MVELLPLPTQSSSTGTMKSYLPRHVEDLDQGQRHRDEAEHQVGDGQVDDENVPGGSHVPVPDHDLC